ncbi:MAG: UvrD-helicase domain-containing protein, partial [Spongiibacteraceae bacterium]
MNNISLSTPIDAAVRVSALDPTRSFCVTAPAGSGKTELLSQRVLRLLAQAEQPEEIFAITFTRKAAAEMQERILAALSLAAKEPEPTAPHKRLTWQLARAALRRDAERGWLLLQNPARLRVLTIDGLCASLTRQLPVLSTFGGSVGISDDPAALYRAAVQSLLELLEGNHAIADALAELLLHLDNDGERLQRLLVGLLANRDQWLRHIGGGNSAAEDSEFAIRAALEATLQSIISDALSEAATRLRVYQGDLL